MFEYNKVRWYYLNIPYIINTYLRFLSHTYYSGRPGYQQKI